MSRNFISLFYFFFPCVDTTMNNKSSVVLISSTVFFLLITLSFAVTPSDAVPVFSSNSGRRGVAENTTCPNNCSDNGWCDALVGECVCDEKWTSDDCSHERKSKLTAFLLEFLIGLFVAPCAGLLYLGYTGRFVGGVLLRFLGWVPLCVAGFLLGCCGAIGKKALNSGHTKWKALGATGQIIGGIVGGFLIFLTASCFFGSMGWWLANWIMILKDEMDDSDGYGLYDDM